MQFIKLDLSNAIASIKLQHAGGNRINFQMREEIFNAVESVAKSDARVLVIKGDGEDFCLGGDVRDWPDVPVDKLRPRVEVFANALDRLEQLDIPTHEVESQPVIEDQSPAQHLRSRQSA